MGKIVETFKILRLALLLSVAVFLSCTSAFALAGQVWDCDTDRDTCAYGHAIDFNWVVLSGGGTFDNPNSKVCVYTPVPNYTGDDVTVLLQVTGTCSADPGITGESGVSVVVFTEIHSITIKATAVPRTVAQGESSVLTAEAMNTLEMVSFGWKDNSGNGYFENPNAPQTNYWPGDIGRVGIEVSGMSALPYLSEGKAEVVLLALDEFDQVFSDVSPDNWAYLDINEVYRLGLVNGYGDGTYGPNFPVDRAQMAVYINRVVGLLSPIG